MNEVYYYILNKIFYMVNLIMKLWKYYTDWFWVWFFLERLIIIKINI